MKINLFKNRKLKKTFKKNFNIIQNFIGNPLVKPVIIVTISLCLLLIIAPYIITKTIPKDEPEIDLTPKTSFDLVKVPSTIKIYRTEKHKTETIVFENYVKGVVSGEMPSSFDKEALKAQSVAARTYSLAQVINAAKNGNPKAHPEAPLCDSTHCQVYRSKSELKELKGEQWIKKDWVKICSAVKSTEGQLLYYNGELVEQALFHSSSGGKTENSEDVFVSAIPYLVSVDSPYESEATHQNEKNSFSIYDFSQKIKAEYPNISFGNINASNIKIISRSSGGHVKKMKIGNGIIEGRNVRETLALPSSNFTINVNKKYITFISNGSGHGVGMSQYGADGMAKKGYNYREILSHYYSGTIVL